jgi:hypothetical protein
MKCSVFAKNAYAFVRHIEKQTGSICPSDQQERPGGLPRHSNQMP